MIFLRLFICAVIVGSGLPLAANAQAQTTLDPCALISASSVADALGVAAAQVGTPQHPSADECVWAVASHAGPGVQRVALSVESVRAASACRGLGCLFVAQSILSLANVPTFSPVVMNAFTDAQMIAALGDKAGWKDGALTVLKNDVAFQLVVSGGGSDAARLAISEALAQTVLTRL